MPPSSLTTGSPASCRRWLCAGRPRRLPTRGCWCSTSGWPPTWAWTRPGCEAPDGVRFLVGVLVPDGATPVAQAYAGHQFGGFVPRLGDGRALLLGEIAAADGTIRDLHLKGSGATPFARGGDGLAAVGPMLREYVVSESMHALGIPTTRSLAVVATGRPVHRETLLPGAVLARVASSHLRVGSFQYAATAGDIDLVRRLADHAIARHHPSCGRGGESVPRAVRGRGRRPGVAGGAVDARRVRARGDEHRQHDDLGRDHRLRAVRLHGGLRPGDGVQLDRCLGPIRLRRATCGGGVEPCPVRRDVASAVRRRPRPSARPRAGVARRVPKPVRRRMVGRHAGEARPCATSTTTL